MRRLRVWVAGTLTREQCLPFGSCEDELVELFVGHAAPPDLGPIERGHLFHSCVTNQSEISLPPAPAEVSCAKQPKTPRSVMCIPNNCYCYSFKTEKMSEMTLKCEKAAKKAVFRGAGTKKPAGRRASMLLYSTPRVLGGHCGDAIACTDQQCNDQPPAAPPCVFQLPSLNRRAASPSPRTKG